MGLPNILHVALLCLCHVTSGILSNGQCGFPNELYVRVCLPQHQKEWIYSNLCRQLRQFLNLPLTTFEALVHRSQSGTFTRLMWKTKPTVGDVSTLDLFPSLAIPTTLVVLVLCDQPMKLWISVFIWNAARSSVLNQPQSLFRFVNTCYWCIFYPEEDVVVWCSSGLILLVKVVGHTFQHSPL